MALASRAWRVVVPRAGGAPLKLAAGFAPLADGSCVASRGGTVVAASAVWEAAEAPGGGGGVPLSVEFRHGSAASGLVPATFNRRDPPRGGDAEVFAARVVDRALRPQICAGYDRLHVEVRVESSDGVHDPVVLGANAASAALGLSGARWAGPVGAVRVGRAGRSWAVDPAWDVVELGGVDVLWDGDAAGGATCVEFGASELEEGRLADALAFAAGEAAAVARAIAALAAEAGRGAPAAVVDPLDAAAASDAAAAACIASSRCSVQKNTPGGRPPGPGAGVARACWMAIDPLPPPVAPSLPPGFTAGRVPSAARADSKETGMYHMISVNP